MGTEELVAFAIFYGYFGIIFLSAIYVRNSMIAKRPAGDLLAGRPFVFLRLAFGGYVCTWYFMYQFMMWSYNSYGRKIGIPNPPMGSWLVNTTLFEQAWRAVCVGEPNWWWSSWICTAAIFFCALIYYQSVKRGIKYPVAYMILGQLVAISVAIALFLTAVYMHEPVTTVRPKAPFLLYITLFAAFGAMYILPQFANTTTFLPVLAFIHAAVALPLIFIPDAVKSPKAIQPAFSIPYRLLIPLLVIGAAVVHYFTTEAVIKVCPSWLNLREFLSATIVSHPAQGSVSLDVIWVAITFGVWAIAVGSTAAVIGKCFLAACGVGYMATQVLGTNWYLIASLVPMSALVAIALVAVTLSKTRTRNIRRRAEVLSRLGIQEEGVVPGTTTRPPYLAHKRTVVGFWHPYCNAGGGGERVLWSAIHYLQRDYPDVVVLVYSGDYPLASKDDILGRVMDRFSIELSPKTLEFVPLPSRHLISDSYWKRFTLLGQSLGSVYLAWEGLCGAEGVWGDIFIDSMGYGFVLPFVRFLVGNEITIGSYTHYPTVSADMVKRVRERSGTGVENAGAAKSKLRTWVKLIYYDVFTSLYSVSLLFSEHTMTNSSWTQAHIQSLITGGKSSLLGGLLLMDDKTQRLLEARGEATADDRALCEVVFPPCDTAELTKLGGLDKRKLELVSLAQFRPEKDHAKQLLALKDLFETYPQYKEGVERIHLTLMGGSRGAADEGRLEGLRKLASDLDIADHVTFLVNAPYNDIVRRLGEASLGLNTMQDEHFGINVVEFMAAGLIPVVHASAGPLLDIVVPYNGQKTGFHATDARSFAQAIHDALSLAPKEQLRVRKAARAQAVDKFSEAAFERGFSRGWERLLDRAELRRKSHSQAQ